VRIVASALDDLEARVGDPSRKCNLMLRGNRKSSRPATTSVGTVISPSRSMTVQPLSSWRPPKMSASGRVFARHSPRIISRASSKMLGWW
jgi:hypothetical protein